MSAFTISRSTAIAAAPEQVRARVEDFHAWRAWSPWEDLDPKLSRSYTGPERGVGATYAWEGNRKAGAGSMEITAATPVSLTIVLRFLKPWRATNQVVFTFAPDGADTHVTWTMTGTHTGLAKLFARFINVEKLIGPDLEKGLARLKELAEN
ncbi:MAG: SRPBCC family protein [Nocardioidaceae bacterium]